MLLWIFTVTHMLLSATPPIVPCPDGLLRRYAASTLFSAIGYVSEHCHVTCVDYKVSGAGVARRERTIADIATHKLATNSAAAPCRLAARWLRGTPAREVRIRSGGDNLRLQLNACDVQCWAILDDGTPAQWRGWTSIYLLLPVSLLNKHAMD
jgi:hypothetical protein